MTDKPVTTWQPIETAPYDREIIGLGLTPNAFEMPNGHTPDCRIVRANMFTPYQQEPKHIGWEAKNDCGWFTVGFHPTHWMELPS